MHRPILIVLLLLSGVSYAGDDLQSRLAGLYFPGSTSIQWTVPNTSEFSTGKEKRDIKPAALGRALKEIGKMGSDLANCDRSIDAYIDISNKYPDKSVVYTYIPTCKVMRWMLHGIADIMTALSEEKKIEILGQDLDSTRALFNKGEKYFLGGMMADETDPQFWKDCLQFYFDRTWVDFFESLMDKMAVIANTPDSKPGKHAESFTKDFLLNFEKMFASGPRMDIARHIIELDPKDTRYKAILGSLLIGQSYTKVIAGFEEPQKGKGNVVFAYIMNVIHRLRGDKGFAANLDEAIDLIKGFGYLNSNARANCDLGLAYLFKEDFESAMGHLYRAIELGPNDEASVYNLVGVFVLRGWAGFANDEQKAAGNRLANTLEIRLSKLKERKPYDYLITAKIFYKLGDLEKAADLLDTGSAVYPDDHELRFARSLVYARTGRIKIAKEILKVLLEEKGLNDEIKSNAVKLADMIQKEIP